MDLVAALDDRNGQLRFDDAKVLVEGAEHADHVLHPIYADGFFYHVGSSPLWVLFFFRKRDILQTMRAQHDTSVLLLELVR